MNFTWRKTTLEDIETFNNWHKYEENKNGVHNNYERYVSHCSYLGDTIMYFCEALDDEDAIVKSMVATYNNNVVGVILYSVLTNKVSKFQLRQLTKLKIDMIAVNPKLFGFRVATCMINDLIKNKDQIFNKKIDMFRALIAKSNIASEKAFENNGFKAYDISNSSLHSEFLLDVKNTNKIKNIEIPEETIEKISTFKKPSTQNLEM